MGTKLTETNAWSDVISPNPGEPVRAGGGIGTPITLSGHVGTTGDMTYTAIVSGVRVRHLGGIGKVLGVTVAGNDIEVQLGTDGAGVPTSTANAVKVAVDLAAAALVTTTSGGAGLAGISSGWTQISAGILGSIRQGLQALVNRTKYIYERGGAWGPPAEFYSEDGTTVYMRGLGGLGSVLTLPGSYFVGPALVADTWYYVYAYSNAGAFAAEAATTVPDGSLQYKTGDQTRRYVGCFRTWDDAGTPKIVPFRAHRGRYTYERPEQIQGGLVNAPDYTTLSLASRVPPHIRAARLYLSMTAAGAATSLRVKRNGGANTYYRESYALANTDIRRDAYVLTDATQQIAYLVTVSGTGAIAVDGFDE